MYTISINIAVNDVMSQSSGLNNIYPSQSWAPCSMTYCSLGMFRWWILARGSTSLWVDFEMKILIQFLACFLHFMFLLVMWPCDLSSFFFSCLDVWLLFQGFPPWWTHHSVISPGKLSLLELDVVTVFYHRNRKVINILSSQVKYSFLK